MAELTFIQWIASIGGIGGVFAVLILFFYRHDRQTSEERLTKVIEADQATREKHTQVLTELITYLKMKNGNKS